MPIDYQIDPVKNDVTGPSPSIAAITPADSNLAFALREIFVGTGGNVQVKDAQGSTVLISNVPSGSKLSGWFTQIMSTNTTASNIVGWR